MDTRLGAAGGEPHLKRARTETPPVVSPHLQNDDLPIEQRLVGWLLGRGGTVIREIEQASGCKIFMNQETRQQGYSVAQLNGDEQQRAHARQLIMESMERAQAPGTQVDSLDGSSSEELQVEQRWVGWLLGRGGGVVKEIQQETGARVDVDQATKAQGYSVVRLSGDLSAVELAKQRVAESLAKVGGAILNANGRGGACGNGDSQTLQVEQKWVGWLLGKGGAVLKALEMATGASVTINQDTKTQGYSTLSVSGTSPAAASAVAQIRDKLRQVCPNGDGLYVANCWGAAGQQPNYDGGFGGKGKGKVKGGKASGGDAFGWDRHQPQRTLEMPVDQKWVGWLLGRGGKTIRDIEVETGASVIIDQSSKGGGFSVVKVSGVGSAVHLAQKRVQASLSLVNAAFATPATPSSGVGVGDTGNLLADEAGSVQVEQRLVGWILGKGGSVLREIEMQSGAQCTIDQSTKDQGFSTVHIVGDASQTARAQQLIHGKLAKAAL
mmetsp:Transcript_631/g.1550  ORF Transcript_631/g.1550 Transcript_631/m.1550 type:complete len:495 (-) Transcript_631:8-1492(-)